MRIYLDLDSRRLLTAPTRPLTILEFKRRDNDSIELQFLRDSTVQELPPGTTARVGIKPSGDYDAAFLAVTTLTQSGAGTATIYGGELNLHTTDMEAAFVAEPVAVSAMLEVEWITGLVVSSSKTLPVSVQNDVIRGNEGTPATLPLFYTSGTSNFLSTQTEAEAGTDNTKWMSPLRTAQAIAANGGGGSSSWAGLTGKPSDFPPSAHSHPLSDLTQSGATSGQVPTWDGTAWVPQATATGVTSYSDLTNVPATFPPSAHTHSASDITSGTLEISQIPTGTSSSTVALGNHTHSGYAAASHTHSASDITSGTLAISRIPFGTTGTTVALGNHTHAIANTTGLQTALDSKLNTSGTYTTIAVVATLPASPDANTIYIVTT